MTVHGYELVSDWENSQCGQTARAVKGGKNYFLKKYYNFKMPLDDGSLDEKTYVQNKELFENFVKYRKKINQVLRPLTGSGGNIGIPCDEFVVGIYYIEATELVENVVPEEEMIDELSKVPMDKKRLLMQTAAGALQTIHKQGIVHSDLKLGNILLAKNALGNYVAKLIDFDSSYFIDEKPVEIIGTLEYYSPEKGYYMGNSEDASEEDRIKMADLVAEKSDIFSLGIIFHQYLSGSFPETVSLSKRLQKKKDKGKMVYCWEALNEGGSLELSGSIKKEGDRALISDMLRKEPSERPTAAEVLRRLRSPDVSAAKDEKTKDVAHEGIPTGFCEPRKEDLIEFDMAAIKAKGYVSGIQEERNGVRGYAFYMGNNRCYFLTKDKLLVIKCAKKKSSDFESPWTEHSFVFDEAAIREKGYVGVSREMRDGIPGYLFAKSDGTVRFMRENMVIAQGMTKNS